MKLYLVKTTEPRQQLLAVCTSKPHVYELIKACYEEEKDKNYWKEVTMDDDNEGFTCINKFDRVGELYWTEEIEANDWL